MKKQNEKEVKSIVLPDGSKQNKKYVCIKTPSGDFALKKKKEDYTIVTFDSVTEKKLHDEKVYLVTTTWGSIMGNFLQLIWFDKKGNLVMSKPFTKVVMWLENLVIVKFKDEAKIIEAPSKDSKLELKSGNGVLSDSSKYVMLYNNNDDRILVEVNTLRVYPQAFTYYEMSNKAGLIAIKLAETGKYKLVRLKDFAESKQYDNVWLYKYEQGEVSKDYAIVQKGKEIGIIKTSNFQDVFINCKKITPINNEYMFIHNNEGEQIIRLADGKIAKW